MDPDRVLQPAGHMDRLVIEAVTESAELHAAAERADSATQISQHIIAGLVEVLVAAGVLTPRKT